MFYVPKCLKHSETETENNEEVGRVWKVLRVLEGGALKSIVCFFVAPPVVVCVCVLLVHEVFCSLSRSYRSWLALKMQIFSNSVDWIGLHFLRANSIEMANPVSAGAITFIFNISLIYVFSNFRALGRLCMGYSATDAYLLDAVQYDVFPYLRNVKVHPAGFQIGHHIDELVTMWFELAVYLDLFFEVIRLCKASSLSIFLRISTLDCQTFASP